MSNKRIYRILSMALAFVLFYGLGTPAFAINSNISQKNTNLFFEIQASPEILEVINDVATTDDIISLDNVVTYNDHFIIFENDTLVNTVALQSTTIEHHQKETLYLGVTRANREGSIEGSESDSSGLFTLSTTVYYTLETGTNGIEFISIDKVIGSRRNLGDGITVSDAVLRIGQTGWGWGGYYTQYQDYPSLGTDFSQSPPASWHPIMVTSEPIVVGATLDRVFRYKDGSTELVELVNNVYG